MSQTANINDRIQTILAGMKDKLGGVIAIFLLDLQTAEVLAAYPQNESSSLEFIGVLCSNNISKFESQAEDLKHQFNITEIDMITQDQQQVYTTRISTSLLLCVIGDTRSFRPGFAKRLVEENVKIDIISTMERMGFMTSQRR